MKETQNWLTYDWELRGAAAEFCVDLQYQAHQPEHHDTLLFLSLSPKKEDKPFSALERLRCDGVLKRVQAGMPHALLVGRIGFDNLQYYFFYTSDPEELDVLDAVSLREKQLVVECSRKSEPHWATYRKLLCPDSARYQTVRNKEQVARMEQLGDNPQAQRRVTLYLFFATEPQRLLFEEDARIAGFATGTPVFRGEQELAYGSAITCVTSLLPAQINAVTTRAIHTAGPHGGQLMDWQCPMVPKKNPLSR